MKEFQNAKATVLDLGKVVACCWYPGGELGVNQKMFIKKSCMPSYWYAWVPLASFLGHVGGEKTAWYQLLVHVWLLPEKKKQTGMLYSSLHPWTTSEPGPLILRSESVNGHRVAVWRCTEKEKVSHITEHHQSQNSQSAVYISLIKDRSPRIQYCIQLNRPPTTSKSFLKLN